MRTSLPILLALMAASPIAVAVAEPASAQSAAQSSPMRTLSYGNDELQSVDYWAGSSRNAPLVIFVHGGGWRNGDKDMMHGSAKLSHWLELGYAVASVNYRLVPDDSVEDQADDVAAAVAHLQGRAGTLGFDADRMALIGHSAGAHLVALVGTDPSYLTRHGLSHDDIDGVVPLDGAAYDVPQQMDDGGLFTRRMYRQAFGREEDRQRALSPTFHVSSSNVDQFLILHVDRDDGRRQSRELGAALNRNGANARIQEFEGRGLRGHAQINRQMGEEDYPATAVVDAFFARIFAN